MPLQTATLLERVGRRIAELREARFTQEEFAERTGYDVRAVQRIEAGRVNFTMRTLNEIAASLRVDPGELFATPISRAKRRPGRPRKREE